MPSYYKSTCYRNIYDCSDHSRRYFCLGGYPSSALITLKQVFTKLVLRTMEADRCWHSSSCPSIGRYFVLVPEHLGTFPIFSSQCISWENTTCPLKQNEYKLMALGMLAQCTSMPFSRNLHRQRLRPRGRQWWGRITPKRHQHQRTRARWGCWTTWSAGRLAWQHPQMPTCVWCGAHQDESSLWESTCVSCPLSRLGSRCDELELEVHKGDDDDLASLAKGVMLWSKFV
jgi:hypothetical protein